MFTHTIDPIMVDIFGLQIRYYGFLFMLAVPVGYYVMYLLFKKRGKNYEQIQLLVIMMIIGVVVGARLVHVIFYNPEMIWEDPVRILMIWHGGVASHGALLGTALGCWLYSLFPSANITFLQTADIIYTTTPLVSIFVRAGNFINSEIVGIPTDGSWGVKFVYYYYRELDHFYEVIAKIQANAEKFADSYLGPIIERANETGQYFTQAYVDILNKEFFTANDKVGIITEAINKGVLDYDKVVPRHPTQIYEILMGIVCFVILYYLATRKKDKLPDGALFGLFLIIYWAMRFGVEFFKEFQTLAQEESFLTMGQYLSIPAVGIGFLILWYAYYRRKKAAR